jgi:hypothetical protein
MNQRYNLRHYSGAAATLETGQVLLYAWSTSAASTVTDTAGNVAVAASSAGNAGPHGLLLTGLKVTGTFAFIAYGIVSKP